jgi:hypothetical protein
MSLSDYSDYNRRMLLMQRGQSHKNERKHLSHYKRVQDLLDSYLTRHASLEFRHNVLRKQKKLNYQLEYDRIRSVLGDNLIPYTTKTMIQKRMAELQKLGARAVNNIQD